MKLIKRVTSIVLTCIVGIILSCNNQVNKNIPEKGKATQRPNIIYILADDLGYADLSVYGQKKFSTPNIDMLAEKGMLFTQHYAGSTVCVR